MECSDVRGNKGKLIDLSGVFKIDYGGKIVGGVKRDF